MSDVEHYLQSFEQPGWEGKKVGMILLDYIQRVPAGTDMVSSAAYKEMQVISNKILEEVANKLQLPVVMGAQITEDGQGRNRKVRIRESQDIAMGAAAWLHIMRHAADDDLREIHIKKNRYGGTPATPVKLVFHGPTFQFTDEGHDASFPSDEGHAVADHHFLLADHEI